MLQARITLEELSPQASHADLEARLEGVLRFARGGIDNLERHSPFWGDDTIGFVTQADKIVVETALLALLASRVDQPVIRRESILLASVLQPFARSERNRVLLLRFPHTAASLGIAHVALSRVGNIDDDFDQLLRRALTTGQVDALERLPYRTMDLGWLRGVLNPDTEPHFDDLLPFSILSSLAHPIYMAETDAYAVTHAIMYLTDFGRRPLPATISRSRLTAMVDACLAWNILGGNLDLLGELLISAVLIRAPWSAYAKIAYTMLTQVWDELGFLPSLAFEPKHFHSLSGDEASAYVFKHIYHSTYVGGILAQVLLGLGEHQAAEFERCDASCLNLRMLDEYRNAIARAKAFCAARKGEVNLDAPTNSRPLPSPEPPTAASLHARTVRRIATYAGACGRAGAPWASAIANIPTIGQEELSLVLSDALIIQAARDYNLPVLMAALLDRADSGLPPSTTLLEGGAFLARQQVPSGAIGAHFVNAANLSAPEAVTATALFADCLSALDAHLQHYAGQSKTQEEGKTSRRFNHEKSRFGQHALRHDDPTSYRDQSSQG
ncbi:MAG TPA: hypothetical protein VKP30_30355 [Polyangiaceae bacterium]|nr:hypothetical protein [Polyangiaceae bacterium]